MATISRILLFMFLMLTGCLLVYFGIYLYGICPENDSKQNGSTHVYTKNNSLETRSLAATQEKNATFINTTQSLVFENRASLSSSLKTEESTVKVPRINTLRGRFKRHTRRKRSNSKEKFPAWQFSLNVTRLDNQTRVSQPKRDELSTEKPPQRLGVSISVGGNDPEDYDRAWNSIESFLKHLFGGNIEELREKGHSVSIDLNSLPSKNVESRSQSKNKKGKFLFGFFGLGGGGNSENPPMDPESDVFDHENSTNLPIDKNSSHTAITESSLKSTLFFIDEMESTTTVSTTLNEFTDVQQLQTTVTNKGLEHGDLVLEEKTTEDLNMHSTSLAEFNKNSLLTSSETREKDAEIESSVSTRGSDFEVRDLGLKEESIEDLNMLSTTFAEFNEDSLSEKKQKEVTEIEYYVQTRENELNDLAESRIPEISTVMVQRTNEVDNSSNTDFRELCTILLERVQKSPKQLEEFNDIEGSGSLLENETSSVASTSQGQTSQNSGFFANILNLITGGRFRHGSSAGTNSEKNSTEDFELDEDQKARLFSFTNLFGSFGSGRSAEWNEFENIEFDNVDLTEHKSDVPTVSECEMFFRRIRRNNSSMKHNFEDTTSSFDKTTTSATESVLSVTLESGDTRNSIVGTTEKKDSFDNAGTMMHLASEPTTQKTDKDGRIFNFLGFGNSQNVGSGSSEVDEGSDRIGITEEGLIDLNTGNKFISTKASQELRIFPGIFNFGSGERSLESFSFEDDTADVTTDNSESVGVFSDFGNEERPMQENLETSSVRYPASDILPLENANAREPYTQDPTYLDTSNYETDATLFNDSEIQTRLPKEHVFFSDSSRRDALTSPGKDRLFAGFLNLLGSGDGRELIEEDEKSSDQTQSGCVVCTVDNGTYPSIKCIECPPGTPTIPSNLETDRFTVFESVSNVKSSSVEPFDHSVPSSTVSAVIPTSNIEPLNGRLFLSGNEESTDQINLVHEAELTSLPSSSLSPRFSRRGRLVDEFPSEMYEKKDESMFSGLNTFERNIPENLSDSSNEVKDVAPNINPTSSPKVEISKQDEELEDGTSPLPSDSTFKNPVELGLSTTVTTRIINRRNMKPKRCFEPSECDESLNEICVTKGHGSFCVCGRQFVRHPVTWKCDEPAPVKVSIRFPEVAFHEDLRDDSSELYHTMRKKSIETIKLFLNHGPELLTALAKVEIIGFEEGSLIVESELVFARSGRNQSLVDFVRKVHANLRVALEDEELLQKAPLNAEGAYLTAVSAVIHRCEAPELHNCSPNARCIPDANDFKCECKEGYLDNSRTGVTGEVCIEICPPNYCGDNGFCDLKSGGENLCLCSGWYFGKQCEVNGLVVIAGFAGLNILVILIITGVVCFCRRRRRRRSVYYGSDVASRVPQEELFETAVSSKHRDNVAMNELGVAGTSKYRAMGSRQTPGPVIQVTSPSIIGSNISYDFDSTFDRSENIEEDSMRL